MPWAGMTPQDRLSQQVGLEGNFWDTLYDISGKIGGIADTVAKGAQAVKAVKSGQATIVTQTGSTGTQIYTVPTTKGIMESDTGKYLLFGGLGLLAVLLLTRRR